ncbi:tRNA uridine-5-carboxymethylaminomethyl(34) synthesis GTPase MnmE [Xanthomonas vesicatoria]|uniref:tRNA uridine-5-carboxymethylaminomethyl(34) synthesis GTPase MnmE n=1 Tax=Xanthomonas vesicatoria TaxID=56460 RepID=UPI001E4C2FF3|nr:tRNA uridine-5-carboxymethylaminomethyl(34) synthesis GTPase MnmE [Xanthomonas vesicatoria]MCC8620173.1 tRNA uridine-5-carboxymethylaminomethyl(34) synthesis GTPase MnmE [Xanthomonas vesicatoria]MCC8628086.1 tRNA uridine-5-carboxymethylaminomethyl(34) synthesis GTPase MnmE [Xanthomonas vesicatoria]MCC8632350.1 tRNA uridine-5-carboxymethylaminomethyl(34) synthesis GTPase MnmE [Xanthomonas vesicatoria]MDG4483258.1 tRNA uridine-5-carboxymethylaminomethyl(34) synthesis GTPase MnmE [Xanthomonas v
MSSSTSTIVAIASAAGAGGVGIVRLSGPQAVQIAAQLSIAPLQPRHAHYARFRDAQGQVIDDGIALWFNAPRSFTGEDVVELQGHGSPVVLRQLVARCIALGARQARAGEFSERAFLNGKLDLAQAEAIADLIAAGDVRAARAARRSLDGVFSRRIDAVSDSLTRLRVHVEAAIDFADEPLDTLGGTQVREGLQQARALLAQLLRDAERGRKLRDGMHAVLIGPPNAGKSSLLNALAGSDRAIVTDVAGTTRDTLHEAILLDGFELTLVDTAGLRDGGDAIEREGMRRARAELQRADLALVVLDARDPQAARDAIGDAIDAVPRQLWIHNKCDLLDNRAPLLDANAVAVSAATGQGLEQLHTRLRELALSDGIESVDGEFSARTRHVDALRRAEQHADAADLELGFEQLELAAEELRLAHAALGEITGKLSADELLGKIFSSFCIGK